MKKLLHHPNYIFLSLILFLLVRISFITISKLDSLTSIFDPDTSKQSYLHSQHNLGKHEFYGNISDDALYTFAGFQYIKGADPQTINFETPFGIKYLYGFSIITFGNANIIQYIFSLSLLASTAILVFQLTQKPSLAVLASLILSFDKLFLEQLTTPLIDLPHALFITLSAIFFIKYHNTTNSTRKDNILILVSFFIGLVAVTKLPITAATLVALFILFIKKSPRNLLQLILPSLMVYFVSHTVFIIYHPKLSDFVNLNISILKLYRSYLPNYPPGEILRIIFIGKWQSWWGQGLIPVVQWSLVWPISTLASILSLKNIKHPSKKPILITSSIVVTYLTTNLFHLVFPRYLLSVLPLMIAALIYFLNQEAHVYWHRWQRSKHHPKSRQ